MRERETEHFRKEKKNIMLEFNEIKNAVFAKILPIEFGTARDKRYFAEEGNSEWRRRRRHEDEKE